MKALITGITGSAGSYLAEYLTNSLILEVHGTSRTLGKLNPHYTIHQCDLLDFSSIYRLLKEVRPDYIFNLAANADVKASFTNPLAVLNNNITSTANLLEAIKEAGIDPIIQHCSTSEVYGVIKQEDCPVSETYPIKPVNIYAVSKLTQEQLALAYNKMYGFKVIITRAFSYLNPRRYNIFSTAFAKQIVDIERGKKYELEHGNLDSVRTLLDVRDVVKAYWYATTKGKIGEIYNIGSTQPISVREFLDLLVSKANVSIIKRENSALLRPIDVTLQIPNVRKFISTTGFYCDYTLDESIEWLLETIRNENK